MPRRKHRLFLSRRIINTLYSEMTSTGSSFFIGSLFILRSAQLSWASLRRTEVNHLHAALTHDAIWAISSAIMHILARVKVIFSLAPLQCHVGHHFPRVTRVKQSRCTTTDDPSSVRILKAIVRNFGEFVRLIKIFSLVSCSHIERCRL